MGSMREKTIKRVNFLGKTMRTYMFSLMPFYGYILAKLCTLIPDDDTRTAYTDGRDIYYSPKFLADKTDGQINFVILHEMYHIVFCHRTRAKKYGDDFNNRVYNIACDYVVNYEIYYLKQSGALRDSYKAIEVEILEYCLMMGGVDNPTDISNRSAEEIYEELMEKYKNCQVKLENNPMRDLNKKGNGQYSSPSSLSEEACREIENEVNKVVKEAALSCGGGKGLGPGMARRLSMINKKTNIRWDRYLCKFLSSRISDEVSYDSPNRKYIPYDLILPGTGSMEDCLNDIFLFFDTSGSMSEDEITEILRNAYTIASNFNCTVSFAGWQIEIEDVHLNVKPENIQKELVSFKYSSGDTDVSCVFDYIEKNKVKSTAVIIFTDGYFTIPTVPKRITRKCLIALSDTNSYDRRLETLGKVVSYKE